LSRGWETYGLAQRPALSNGDLVTILNTESWRDVRSEVLVSLLVSGVFGDEVKVLAADDEGSVHLGGDDSSGQDTATDGNETGKGALLVCRKSTSVRYSVALHRFDALMSSLDRCISSHRSSHLIVPLGPEHKMPLPRTKHRMDTINPHTDVGSLNGGLWCPESQSNVLVPSSSSLADSARLGLRLGVEEDVRLLLESALRLNSEFGGHGCVCGGCRSRKSRLVWILRRRKARAQLSVGSLKGIEGLRVRPVTWR
jgi:hypothetical protein